MNLICSIRFPFFFVVLPLVLSAQPDFLWINTFESSTWDEGHCVRETMDNGFIIGGLTGAQGYDVYLIKTDFQGDTLWTRTYGGSGWDEARMVQQTSDGGYITAGRTTSFGAADSDIYIIKTDAQGDTLWTRMYGGNEHDDSQWIGEIIGEGYIIAGQTFSYGAGGSDIILIKIDTEGNIIWLETYGDAGDEDAQWAQFTSDGGIVITGSMDVYGTGDSDVYIVKTDINGELLWTETYGGTDTDLSLSIQEVSTGGYIISGQTESFGNGNDDVYLIRTDGEGNLLWEKTYGHVQADGGSSIQETPDGGFVVAGVLTTDEGGFDACFIKTDENGDSLWTKLYYSNTGWDNWDIAFSIQVTSDNGYVATGLTGLYPQFDVFILKLTSEFENNYMVINVPGDYPTIQAGINAASDGDTVLVQPGTYIENITFDGKNIVVKSFHGAEETIIDGNQNESVVLFNTGEDDTAILKGFSLRNGTGTNVMGLNCGGGILCFQSDPTLQDLIIGENHVGIVGVGGGIALWNSNSTIENVLVNGNSSAAGGGIYTFSSEPVFKNVTVINNWTFGAFDAGGGGMAFQESSPQLFRVNISENSSGVSGGGLSFTQCESVLLTNITVSNNTAEFEEGSIYLFQTDASIVNSIIWNDSSTYEILFHDVNNWGSVTVSYSDIQGGIDAIETNNMGIVYWEEGNMDSDPLFVDLENGDYHLQGDSPCIDAGDPDLDDDGLTWEDDTDDQDPDGTRMDMGAYEFTGLELATVIVDYMVDWNLVGLPVEVEDASYSNLFPESIDGTLYSFGEGYILDSTLVHGEGYWLRFNNGGSTTIDGTPINELTISLNEDWNLVSGLSEDISIYSVSDPDSIIIPGTLYGFNEDGYVEADILVPGNGYWVRAFEAGEITLTSGALAKTAPRDFSLKGKANSLTVNGMDLYFGVKMSAREKLSYSLPPKPPHGAFDVRFSGDTRIAGENTEMEVMSTHQTLTISYNVVLDAGEHMNWVLSSSSGEEYTLEGTEAITIPSSESFVLKREPVIPITFALHQNYPNPFNPITSLRYDLPEQAQVTLTVYDLMGREVTQLVNTTQEAGYRSAQWDATAMHGKPVSAGVYLYQIQAGEFVQTRKMVLLK